MRVSKATFDAIVAAGGRPQGAAWDALGVAAAEPFWLLPASPQEGLPWFGLSTEGIPPGLQLVDGAVRFDFTITSGPDLAQFSSYAVDPFGAPSFHLSTTDGLMGYSRPTGVHEHMNWTFSAAGWWTVEVVISAEETRGAIFTSAPAPLRFYVEP